MNQFLLVEKSYCFDFFHIFLRRTPKPLALIGVVFLKNCCLGETKKVFLSHQPHSIYLYQSIMSLPIFFKFLPNSPLTKKQLFMMKIQTTTPKLIFLQNLVNVGGFLRGIPLQENNIVHSVDECGTIQLSGSGTGWN